MSDIFQDAIDATLNRWTVNGTSLKVDPTAKQKIITELRRLDSGDTPLN